MAAQVAGINGPAGSLFGRLVSRPVRQVAARPAQQWSDPPAGRDGRPTGPSPWPRRQGHCAPAGALRRVSALQPGPEPAFASCRPNFDTGLPRPARQTVWHEARSPTARIAIERVASHGFQRVNKALSELGSAASAGARRKVLLAGDTPGTQMRENAGINQCFPVGPHIGLISGINQAPSHLSNLREKLQ